MKIYNKEKFIKKLFIYRTSIFKFTKFETDLKDKELNTIIQILNIKNKYKRMYLTIEKICEYIDDYYKEKNLCKFENCTCICHRNKNINYKNGCCRKCIYQSNKGCTTKNVACKLFYCSHAKENNKILKFEDIYLIKILTPFQRLILSSDYFQSIEEVSIDLCFGPLSIIYIIPYRIIKNILKKNKNT